MGWHNSVNNFDDIVVVPFVMFVGSINHSISVSICLKDWPGVKGHSNLSFN